MSAIQLPTKKGLVKAGIGAGLVAGFALFSSFFAIDQMLDIPTGTFYKTIIFTSKLLFTLGYAVDILFKKSS